MILGVDSYVLNVEQNRRQETKNSKHETRNSKQFQMTKIGKILNKLPSDSVFWIFRFEICLLSLFRISIFEFRILVVRLLAAINFVEVPLRLCASHLFPIRF